MVLDIFTRNGGECSLLAWLKHYRTGKLVHIERYKRGQYRILFSQKYKDGSASFELVEVWPWRFNRYQGTEGIRRTSRQSELEIALRNIRLLYAMLMFLTSEELIR